MKSVLFLCLALAVAAPDLRAEKVIPPHLIDYWYQGKAELTRYELHQARYGESHSGDAVLIFVTEDFLTDEQVKHEYGDGTSESVLKLNFSRNFTTGIYPYSVMTSIFTPVNPAHPRSLKVTASAQEWCGHTYMQLNYRDSAYQGILRSYFQREGDQELSLEPALLEDELWTRIRLAPDRLPVGEIDLIPGAQYLRFAHRPIAVEPASAELIATKDPALSEGPLRQYRIEYKNLPRKLTLTFEAEFPHAIVAWEETYAQGRRTPRWVTTRGVKTHTLLLDYWSRHSAADSTYRAQLGLQ